MMSMTGEPIVFLSHIDVVAMLFTILLSCYLEVWDKMKGETWACYSLKFFFFMLGLMTSILFFQFKIKGINVDNSNASILFGDQYSSDLLMAFWTHTFLIILFTSILIVVHNKRKEVE